MLASSTLKKLFKPFRNFLRCVTQKNIAQNISSTPQPETGISLHARNANNLSFFYLSAAKKHYPAVTLLVRADDQES